MNRFIRELRRREVFRTAGLYVGVCWILIEASSVLLPTFDAPEWIMRAVVIVAVVGFPVMLVLAWIYDVSERGIEVQADPTDTIVAPLGSRKMDFVVIGLLTVALIFSVYMNLRGPEQADAPLAPMSVLIADFENGTGNPLFNGLLEQALAIGIEGAPHVTSYQRNDALQLASRLQAGATGLDAAAARLIAVREGIDLVLSGSIEASGRNFSLALSGVDPESGAHRFDASADAGSANDVLAAVASLSDDVREALGDTTVNHADATTEAFTAASLEAAQAYTTAIDLAYEGRHEEAVESYRRATELDPNFGRAYSGWALSEFKLGRTEQANELWNTALSLMDTMTERERLRTLGLYYGNVTGNFDNAVQSFKELVEKYPADAAGHNNLAVSAFLMLDFRLASEEGRRLMEIYPASELYRSNYALFSMYSGDFEAAAAVATDLIADNPGYGTSYLPLAMHNIDAGRFDAARDNYLSMAEAETSHHRASFATMGLADLAIFRGRYADAISLLEEGIAADVADDNPSNAAVKHVAAAEVHVARGDDVAAIESADAAVAGSGLDAARVAAARVYAAAGASGQAEAIAGELERKLQPQSRAYGLMVRAILARNVGDYTTAVDRLRTALNLADLWLVRLELGRTYLAAGFFAEALSEFTHCEARRGEATAVFLDDMPTFRHASELPYWIGRAELGVGMSASAAMRLERFLTLRPEGGRLAEDARQRLN